MGRVVAGWECGFRIEEPCTMDDLSRLPFFTPFPGPVLAALAAVARWRAFEPGQTVLEAGDPAHEVFFIAEGEVRIITRGRAGQEIILNELGPGRFFGEIAAIDSGPRSAGVMALTRCRICVIAAGPFMRFALSTPEASHHVMRLLAGLGRAGAPRARKQVGAQPIDPPCVC